MYEAPANAGSREELDYAGSIVRSFILYCKRLFPRFEFVIIKSHRSNFTIAPKLLFKLIDKKKKHIILSKQHAE